jgi:hypothetical protein
LALKIAPFKKSKIYCPALTIPIYTTPKNPFPINQLASYACQEALHG